LVVNAEKKEHERKRKRKTLLSKKRKCAQKEFDRADIVRDVRLALIRQLVRHWISYAPCLTLDWVGKYSAQNFLPVSRCLLKAPELWSRGFEAKANFGPAAMLLT